MCVPMLMFQLGSEMCFWSISDHSHSSGLDWTWQRGLKALYIGFGPNWPGRWALWRHWNSSTHKAAFPSAHRSQLELCFYCATLLANLNIAYFTKGIVEQNYFPFSFSESSFILQLNTAVLSSDHRLLQSVFLYTSLVPSLRIK